MMKRQNNQITRREFLRKGIIASAGLVVGAKAVEALADYVHQSGKLSIENALINYGDFDWGDHNTVHALGGTEGDGPGDDDYHRPIPWNPAGLTTKIISRIPDHELKQEANPLNSLTPINLELNLVSKLDVPITLPDVENELWCSFVKGNTFNKKPICLYRKIPGKGLKFLADIRKAIAKNKGIISLPNLNGTFSNWVRKEDIEGEKYFELTKPYDYLQIIFDFPGNFDLHSRVDLSDLTYMSKDWRETDINSIADISGPNGIPDKNVDFHDFSLFARDYLKNINDPNTW